jgi:cytochrome P450
MNISINKKYQAAMASEAILALNDILATPHDFDRHFLRYSYGVVGRCFFGKRIASASDPWVVSNESFLNEVMTTFDPTTFPTNIFAWLKHLPKGIVTSMAKMEQLRDLNDEKIRTMKKDVEESMQPGSMEEHSIFAAFLSDRDSYDVSDAEAGSAFFALIGGGTRSPHNALMAFLYLMMAYPEWLIKLQKHVDEVVGPDRLPTWEDIPNLPMVRAVVKEGIRYRSIVAELGIPHTLDEDDEFGGYKFEKGTVFHANYG